MARLRLATVLLLALVASIASAALNDTEPLVNSIVRKSVVHTLQTFADQFRYEMNLNFLKNLGSTVTDVLSRTPVTGLTTKSLLSFNLVSLAILVVSVFLTYILYPFISGAWFNRVTGLDFNFLNRKVDEIHKRVST